MVRNIFATEKLYISEDYRAFRRAPGLRDLSQSGVRDKIKSLSANGYIKEHPIIVVALKEFPEFFFVVDGQHRLAACERLGIPFIYRVVPDSQSLFETVKSLNMHVRPWRPEDFLKTYAEIGEEAYIKTKNFLEEHNFGIRSLLSANERLNFFTNSSNELKEAFRSGEIVVDSEGYANTSHVFSELNLIADSSKAFQKIKNQKHLIIAYSWFRTSRKFEIGRLIEGCRRRPSNVGIPTDSHRKDVRHLMEIYNFRISSHSKIFFSQTRRGLWVEED